MIYLCEKSRKTSSTETEIILVVAEVGGMREVGRKMLNAYRILGNDGNVLELGSGCTTL